MESQQILVYDKQHYFLKFLKLQFKNFNFHKVKNEENFYEPTAFTAVVFVIYSESELFDFLNISNKGKQVLVCTYNAKILEKMKNFSSITLVDTSNTKIEIIKDIRNFFEQFEVGYAAQNRI